jgi:hypothetical protein
MANNFLYCGDNLDVLVTNLGPLIQRYPIAITNTVPAIVRPIGLQKKSAHPVAHVPPDSAIAAKP